MRPALLAMPLLPLSCGGQGGGAIRDMFGAAVVVPTALAPDVEEHGFFSIGASVSSLSSRGVEQYEAAAFSVAEQAGASE